MIRLGLGAGLHFFFLESIKPLFERQQPDGSVGMTAMGAMVTGGWWAHAARPRVCVGQHASGLPAWERGDAAFLMC